MRSFFACPACGAPLQAGEKLYCCENGHSYDRAAKGYVHLLPPNQMHSRLPGDNKEMVASRRRFLNAGYYGLFSHALNELALSCLRGSAAPAVLDAGCGEGYYTCRLQSALLQNEISPRMAGFDISKLAVKAAAGRGKTVEWAVASAFHIPVPAGAADLLLNVFAPVVPQEFARVVKPGGFFLLAVPSPRHLYGLKEILYTAPYENETKDTAYPGFRFLSRTPVRGELALQDPAAVQDLFAMTPYFWKTPEEGSNRLRRTESLHTEIGFDFLLYQREG